MSKAIGPSYATSTEQADFKKKWATYSVCLAANIIEVFELHFAEEKLRTIDDVGNLA